MSVNNERMVCDKICSIYDWEPLNLVVLHDRPRYTGTKLPYVARKQWLHGCTISMLDLEKARHKYWCNWRRLSHGIMCFLVMIIYDNCSVNKLFDENMLSTMLLKYFWLTVSLTVMFKLYYCFLSISVPSIRAVSCVWYKDRYPCRRIIWVIIQ